jgi:hypothetical protein
MKKYLSPINHKGNINQNYTEIPFHPSQDDNRENKQQILGRIWSEVGVRNLYTLLIGF